jgi:hypothetical protein
MTITANDIKNTFLPYLNRVFFDYNTYPDLYSRVYKRFTSDQAVEYDLEMVGMGPATKLNPGDSMVSDDMGEAFKTAYVHNYWSKSFEITRQALMDNQYKHLFENNSQALRASLMTVKNMNAMYLFNNAFNSASALADGVPMLSTQHPYRGGTYANTFNAQVGFSQQAVEELRVLSKTWKSASGLPIVVNTEKLLIPPSLESNAFVVTKSEYRSGTANNDINPVVKGGYLPGGVIVNPFLTDDKAWFILTDYREGFKMFVRENIQIGSSFSETNFNIKSYALERYSMNCSSPKAVLGSSGR